MAKYPSHNPVPAADPLPPWNPLSYLRLLKWVFLEPRRLQAYRDRRGAGALKDTGAWLTSVLLWLPLFIPFLGVGIGTLPTAEQPVPLWLVCLGVVVGWLLTGALASRERDRSSGWRAAFGEVFSNAFLFALGLAIGIGFGMGITTAFDIMDIVAIEIVFGSVGVIVFVVAFGLSFAMAIVIADNVTFAGAFIVTPVLAFLVAGQVAFGTGFVGVFLSIFLLTFCIAFTAGFASMLVISPYLARIIERNPDSAWSPALRIVGLVVMLGSYAVLAWMCLLGGWQTLV